MTDSLDSELLEKIQVQGLPFEAVLDPLCVVNTDNKILFANAAMKALLGLRKRELDQKPVFCDLLQLAACKDSCQIKKAIITDKALRLDESPATRGEAKMRIILKAIPLHSHDESRILGLIITLRDTTAEVVVQAKYHKLMEVLQTKNELIEDLEYKVLELRAKVSRFAKIAR